MSAANAAKADVKEKKKKIDCLNIQQIIICYVYGF